jgi:hypothetical protein
MAIVEVYHSLGNHVSIEAILKEGLKSRRKLIEEGTLKQTSDLLFPDQNEIIYFRWMNPDFARGLDTAWVSIEVNPKTAKVFNAEFRYDADRRLYLASEMPLSELIEKKERGEAMKGTVPGKFVVYNLITAEPTLVDFKDARVSNRHWIYSNEIPVKRDVIPASEFKTYHRAESR